MQPLVIKVGQSEWRLFYGLLQTYMVLKVPRIILICAENDALDLTHIHTLSKTLWQIVRNSAKTVYFHNIPTSGNQVKFRYFMER